MSENDIQKNDKKINILKAKEPAYLRVGLFGLPWVFWGVVLLYGLSTLLYGYKLGFTPSTVVADWGQFGDFFGGFINPIVGLVTIVLFAASLRQSQVAISQSEQALLQNEKILKATLEELKITRQTAEAGQAIQAATENALKQQIEISMHEKHFNTVLALHEKYEKHLEETKDTPPRFATLIAQREQTRLRSTFLSRYMDSNFNDVVEKAVDSGFDPSIEFARKQVTINGYPFSLYAVVEFGYVKITGEGVNIGNEGNVFYWSDPSSTWLEIPHYVSKIEYMHESARTAVEAFLSATGVHEDGKFRGIPGLSWTPRTPD